MAKLSCSKLQHLRPPRVYPGFYGISGKSPLNLIKQFCSTTSVDDPLPESFPSIDPIQETSNESEKYEGGTLVEGGTEQKQRTPRGKNRNPEKTEDIIARMMANRAWTTRLQNSIRNLVPQFDQSLVLNVLDSSRKTEHALQFFRWIERSGLFKHDRETHMKIIERLGRSLKLNHAREILMDMPKKGVHFDEDMFVVLIESYGKNEIVQESVKIFQQMKELGVERTGKSYDALFKVILRQGRYMMAKRYYNKMLEEGIAPTKHTFNILLWGFFLCQKAETANRFYEDMRNRGIMPDVVTYNTMINGFYRLKNIEEAEKFFVEMKGKNIAPTVISYTTMIKGYVAMGKVDDALRMFQEMKDFGIRPNSVTYSTLLPGLCDAKKPSEAQIVLREMVERHAAPKDNSIFVKLLNCQCESGNLNAAVDVLKAMIRLSIPTEAGHYGILIENSCKAKAYDQAVNLLDKLIEKDIVLRPQSTLDMEPTSYNAIIEYLCNNGDTKRAETLFRQLMKKGVQDPKAFNNLIRGHSKEKNPEAAFELLNIMIRRGVSSKADAYKLLIHSFLEKGEPADAKTVLDSMIENDHLPDSAVFRAVMEGLFNDERVQTASRVMKMMLEKGLTDNMDLSAKILEALFMRGHVEEALGRIELLMHSGCAPDIDNLLSVMSDKGKTIAALKLLDFALERDFTLDFSSYDKVLDALIGAGKTLNAYSILCKISLKGGVTDKSSYESLIKTLNEEGNSKQADVLSRMLNGEIGDSTKKGKKQKLVAS
ncbi:pentatricopeptide repeat-containing protein At2g37230-like [Chenopodium quinoa]|uniref:pentatricopeptide repeat-containing protein At2g37230-like n=1 Tax=Chenopodium quinoa TaxID=63459 RepID=UPI000B778BD8|nr:pentatricopeptide repeat-containing protein At2g37230-like [Chenopodium quinoa]